MYYLLTNGYPVFHSSGLLVALRLANTHPPMYTFTAPPPPTHPPRPHLSLSLSLSLSLGICAHILVSLSKNSIKPECIILFLFCFSYFQHSFSCFGNLYKADWIFCLFICLLCFVFAFVCLLVCLFLSSFSLFVISLSVEVLVFLVLCCILRNLVNVHMQHFVFSS